MKGKISLSLRISLFFVGIGVSYIHFSKKLLHYTETKNQELLNEMKILEQDIEKRLTSLKENSSNLSNNSTETKSKEYNI